MFCLLGDDRESRLVPVGDALAGAGCGCVRNVASLCVGVKIGAVLVYVAVGGGGLACGNGRRGGVRRGTGRRGRCRGGAVNSCCPGPVETICNALFPSAGIASICIAP